MPPRTILLILSLLIGLEVHAVNARHADARALEGRWLIKVSGSGNPRLVAEAAGAKYNGPLKGVEGYHRIRFIPAGSAGRSADENRLAQQLRLQEIPDIVAFEQEFEMRLYPRSFVPPDPLFPSQWHLENVGQAGGMPYSDARVRPAWDLGLSGEGVVIAIVDEGIEYRHPDLVANWLTGSGVDYNGNDNDPSPGDFSDRHGTAVAGISLAASNMTGGLGVAYNASLVPIRLIAGTPLSGEKAEALSYLRDTVDVYNNSWGPSDLYIAYAPLFQVVADAFRDNVTSGRNGLGNIYVWAAGNGGLNGDNSNYDGYNASPYTISVGALGDDDMLASYSEPGANLLVVAPSRGNGSGILTTDNTGESGYSSEDTFDNFSGTSAAAPIVSGVVALMLEARPDLTWRDVQEILARTAVPVDFSTEKWDQNGAGLWVSHLYGFGRVNAHGAVMLARDWRSTGPVQTVRGSQARGVVLSDQLTSRGTISLGGDIVTQLVRVTVECNHSDWGDLRMELVSPSGTRSILAESHADGNEPGFPGEWTYLSTRHLGEPATGQWKLEITDEASGGSGRWVGWGIEVLGTASDHYVNRDPAGEDLVIQSTTYPVEVDILEGMQDPDGDPLGLLSVQPPGSGTLEELGEGRFRFTMGETLNGSETFSALVGDGKGGVKRRLVRVLDPRPVVRNDLFPVVADESVSLPVLANDLDPDGDPLRIVSVSGAGPAQASIGPNGSIEFSAPAGWSGVSRLQYRLTDDSDGESSGWATVVTQAVPDIALDFDGEDDYLRLPPTSSLSLSDRFTAEAWIYPEDWGEFVTGFGRIYDRDYFVFFLNGFDHAFYNDRSLVAYFVLSDGTSAAANSLPNVLELDKWQHVAVSYDSSNPFSPVRMYVDGVQVSVGYPIEGGTPPFLPIADTRSRPLYIGETESGARAFNGRMSEFRIWNRVLDPAVVQLQHDQRLGGGESGLQFYLPLDQTLEPYAVSTGAFGGTVDISGAHRIPRNLPWESFQQHYTLVRDAGNGWWEERTLGWLFGDAYPWVYSPALGWVYGAHGTGKDNYLLYRASTNWGWLQTTPSYHPWFYLPLWDRWMWYMQGTSNPAWFYDYGSSSWLRSVDNLPGP
jgi:subtilisin-like proprotein convertase family protein